MPRKSNQQFPQTIGFINDLHVGSHFSLYPRRLLPKDEESYIGIRYLNDCWDELVEWMPELDILYLNGDLIDGDSRKAKGTGVFSTKLSDQVDAAIEILRPLIKKCKKVARVWGTPYHEDHMEPLTALDKEFKIKQSRQIHWLKLDCGWMNIAHHPCSGPTLYDGTALDKEGLWASIAASKEKVYDTRWIIRAHKHYYARMETEDKCVVISPCFKLQDPYAAQQNFWKFHPTIGGFYLKRNEDSNLKYDVIKKLFPTPKPDGYNWQSM